MFYSHLISLSLKQRHALILEPLYGVWTTGLLRGKVTEKIC